jgi:hypothetical protein
MIPLLFLLLAADPGGYLASRWGMTPDQVLAAVPQAIRDESAKPFRGAVASIIIREVQIATLPMQVSFRFGQQSGRLENVLLQPVRDQDKAEGDFERIEALLVEKYGRPWISTTAEGRTSRWSFETTAIELSYYQSRTIAFRSLSLVYRPRDTNSPI